MIKRFNANKARLRRHQRIRTHLVGSQVRPRLNVFRSDQHIYAQIIDDATGQTLVAASSIETALREFKPAVVAPASSVQAKAEREAAEEAAVVLAAETTPAKGKGAKVEKAAKA